MNNQVFYTCPCCGYKTRDEEHYGSYNICSVCFWEDDASQVKYPDMTGANRVSLKQAQKNFIAFGTCELNKMRRHAPIDRDDYDIDINWKPIAE